MRVYDYIFDIVVLAIYNRKKCLLKGITRVERAFTNDMLHFSVPLIFSGISWWVVSSSDRYFVSWMCGSAANGVYAVAYKIPVILQTLDNVFGQAWLYTLYDSYKTDDGRNYIAKVFDAYNFLFCLGCSFLIIIDLFYLNFYSQMNSLQHGNMFRFYFYQWFLIVLLV